MTKAARAICLGTSCVGKIRYRLGAKACGMTLQEVSHHNGVLDCSGFIRQLLKEVSIAFVDGSQQQKAACRKVSVKLALGPHGGGLLLFMSPKAGKSWPRHVALSMGHGYTLECRSSAGVCIVGPAANKRRNWTSAGKIDKLMEEYGG